MPMFYFNVIVGNDVIPDLEGTELDSLDDARLWAIEDARTLMSAAVLNGQDISQRSIRICDASGKVLLTVRFADAIRPE